MKQYDMAREEVLQNLLATRIAEAIENLSNIHPEARIRNYWIGRAEAFVGGDGNERDHVLADIGKGLLILLATPFALAGACSRWHHLLWCRCSGERVG